MEGIYASVGRECVDANLSSALRLIKGRRWSCPRMEERYNLPMPEHRSDPQDVTPLSSGLSR